MLGNWGHGNPNRQASQGIPIPPPPCPSASSSFLTWDSLWPWLLCWPRAGRASKRPVQKTLMFGFGSRIGP